MQGSGGWRWVGAVALGAMAFGVSAQQIDGASGASVAPVAALASAAPVVSIPSDTTLPSVEVAAPAGLESPSPRLTPDAAEAYAWVRHHRDHGDRPFAIVDKRQARVYVFHGDGALAGESAALLGLAPGDQGVPGAGQRVASLAPHERTTPAGRFASEPGHNLDGEAIVWVDYDAAIAIHRVRPGPARERREQRLSSATPADNRVSLGCIVVPGAFYDEVVAPLLGRRRGVVYVLPESQPTLAGLATRAHAAAR